MRGIKNRLIVLDTGTGTGIATGSETVVHGSGTGLAWSRSLHVTREAVQVAAEAEKRCAFRHQKVAGNLLNAGESWDAVSCLHGYSREVGLFVV